MNTCGTSVDGRTIEALKTIKERIGEEDIRWVIVASTSLALQGVDIEPKDIDILTDKEGAFQINILLKEYETKPVSFGRFDPFRSYFGKFEINGIGVEVMGDLETRINDRWVRISHRLNEPKVIKLGDFNIPVSCLQEHLEAYVTIGRENDKIKIEKIRETLREDEPMKSRSEQPLEHPP